MTKKESIVEKIQKLLNKADSAKQVGSLHEAEVFATKATELLLQHNLSISDVEDFEKSRKESITQSGFDEGIKFGQVKSDGKWEIDLLGVLSEFNFCQSIFRIRSGKASVIGTKENIEVVKYLFEILRPMLKQMSSEAFNKKIKDIRENFTIESKDKREAAYILNQLVLIANHRTEFQLREEDLFEIPNTWNDGTGTVKFTVKSPENCKLIAYRKVWIRSYLKGAVSGIYQKLLDDRNALQSEVKDKVAGLVLVNNAAVQEFVKTTFGKLGTLKTGQASEAEAYRIGHSEGKKIKVAKGVSNGDTVTTKHLN